MENFIKRALPILLVLMLYTLPTVLFAQDDAPDPTGDDQAGQPVYLPIVSSDNGGQAPDGPTAAPPTEAPEETSTATPIATATVMPTEQPTEQPTELPTELPEDEPAATPTAIPTSLPESTPMASPTASPTATTEVGGLVPTAHQCPAGMNLQHISGMSGIVGADTFSPTVSGWADYRCVADESVETLACSVHGTATLLDGIAACACEEGFGGSTCDEPLPDVETPAVAIAGSAQSLTAGDVVELSAQSAVVNAADQPNANGTWRIVQGEGCLRTSREATDCQSELTGESVLFEAAASVAALETTLVKFEPAGGGAAVETTVLTQPPGSIPIHGFGPPALEPALAAVEQFMQESCVGAGTIGISRYGIPVGVWGLGKIHGRASSTIFNPECPSDAIDPHYPTVPNIKYDSPFPIGSVSKSVSYAVGRWAIQGRLQERDVDVDTAALSPTRLASLIRTQSGELQLQLWAIGSNGIQSLVHETQLGSARDFSMVRLSDSRLAVGLRKADSTLAIRIFDVDESGQLVLRGTGSASTVRQVELAAIALDGGNADRLVAAVKTEADELKLVVYTVSEAGQLTRVSDVVDEAARDFAVAAVGGGEAGRLVTAVRRADHTMSIKSWEIDAAGNIAFSRNKSLPDRPHAIEMTRLSDSRVVVAISTGEMRKNAALKLLHVGISPTGLIDVLGEESAGIVGDFDLVERGPSGFVVAVRAQNGTLKVVNWLVDNDGAIQRQDEASAGVIHGVALASQRYGSETPNSTLFAAVRTAENLLKIVPWRVTGPTPQRLAAEVTGGVITDYSWTNEEIEALYLTGFELPEGLLPERLDRIMSGRFPLPSLDPPIGDVSIENDKTGEVLASCEALGDYADTQWQQVQLKHLFAHRTGLPRSAIQHNTVVANYVDELRGLNVPQDYAEQEALLRAQFGNARVEQGRAALGWSTAFQPNGNTEGYLTPQASIEEMLVAVAARCLPYSLGQYNYSNTDPVFMQQVIEHLTETNYATADGFPGTHEESALYRFFLEELGVETSATDGIFAASVALENASDNPVPGPTARSWDEKQSGGEQVYPTGWDRKRPHCVREGTLGCSFSGWASATLGRVNWYWAVEQVRLPYYSHGQGAATGGLRMEPLTYLRFLSQYWVSGYSVNPRIGEARNGNWTLGATHNGSGGGMHAEAIQFGNTGSCTDAPGVDVIVAVNQNADKTEGAYKELYNVVRDAVCEIDWDEIVLFQPLILDE